MTDVKYPKRWPFVASGIFMIFCSFVWILRQLESVIDVIRYDAVAENVGWLISIAGYSLLFFILGIVIIAAKNSIGTMVLWGLYIAQEIYWLIDTVKYYLEYYLEYSYDLQSLILLAADVFLLLALVTLFLIALVSRINQKNGLVKVWFIPFLFSFLSMLAIIVNWSVLLVNRFDFEYAVRFVFNLLVISSQMFALLFFGLGLKMAMNKRPAVKVVSGVNQNQMNANVRPERDRETNIPSFGATVQMPKPSPIMQPATAPQQEKRTSDDEMMEIRKFKQLLDDGIITEEEFNRKKQELLGL